MKKHTDTRKKLESTEDVEMKGRIVARLPLEGFEIVLKRRNGEAYVLKCAAGGVSVRRRLFAGDELDDLVHKAEEFANDLMDERYKTDEAEELRSKRHGRK